MRLEQVLRDRVEWRGLRRSVVIPARIRSSSSRLGPLAAMTGFLLPRFASAGFLCLVWNRPVSAAVEACSADAGRGFAPRPMPAERHRTLCN